MARDATISVTRAALFGNFVISSRLEGQQRGTITMPAGNSLYQRKPGRLARQKKEFGSLIQELKKIAGERGYTKKQIVSELGVSLVAVSQWWSGYTLRNYRKT